MDDKDYLEVVVEVAKNRSKDVYEDGLKPATVQTGEVLGTVVGFFNNVVLYPIKRVNMSYVHKLEMFSQELEAKTARIPQDKLMEPKMSILGPTVEALKYNYEEVELKDMFLNLLTSAMNTDKVDLTHPSYVDIIKSMNGFDATILKKMVSMGQCPSSRTTIGFDNKVFSEAIPKKFAPDLIGDKNPYQVSASIDNMIRLGLVKLFENKIIGYNYDDFKEHPFVKGQFDVLSRVNPDRTLVINVKGHALQVTDFGRNFAKSCIQD
ncbi:MAG: hypothetical protein CVU95_13495 [Firmicutes bacterium HGW-Firmicutes-2]|jgi:hypothetical protein|nr:MAG: hypothetical protein CVU95_13495 [Firmicutes bacterium HGW-Firmicutes-2]